ncbi:Sugar (pentulose or hexulose) kinase [Arboricoccus pini]|uniref:Sugar (Pentulose or hexulose) kinase n=1 Tax=Arboricoccus pini TaxID=1963835 RepID=A0A212S1A3_9PROT|nr:FGGY family carbohydrate kinase [Arboricoccus pini]SNB78869.1 Sugar (pentulose or hexulose) kinase [Arboricoccus pini]
MSHVAVFDIGKTNAKLSAVGADGQLALTLGTPNRTRPGPPYSHHALDEMEAWLCQSLAELHRRHPIEAIVLSGHGSGGVLVDADGPTMPMIDYETTTPPDVDARYQELVGSFVERGSSIMLGAAHLARQLLWLETGWPEQVAGARYFLPLPQYWAWRLSGVAATEVTSLAAQSHLWNVTERRFASIVGACGWTRLMPPLTPAWTTLGPLTEEMATRIGLPHRTRVLCGIHDSSANLYRYQAAGLADMTVVSTGTWLVAINDRPDVTALAEQAGLSWNSDVRGQPLAGVLTMAGREYGILTGNAPPVALELGDVAELVAAGTMALPSFGADDGFFPGSAGKGMIAGPAPTTPASRQALAVLHMALLTDTALNQLPPTAKIILDGSFVREPLFPALVAALRREPVFVSADRYGTATGAALLASHAGRVAPAPITLARAEPASIAGLDIYHKTWRERVGTRSGR